MELRRVEALIERLGAERQPWRVDAERQLVELGSAAVGPLLEALEKGSPPVRLHAVRALGQIGDPRGLLPVVAALGDAENFGAVAIAAEKALVQWGEPAKAALVAAAVAGPAAASPRALRALGAIGGEDLEAVLRPMLGSAVPAIRLQAAAALGKALGGGAVGIIAPLLGDEDPWVRCGVAEALLEQGSKQGEEVLRKAASAPGEGGEELRAWAEELIERLEEL
ncbi:MAG: HEAT repeat domain-containing protein [Myxococcaceae bacterium]